jgi:5'-methylthioadenosine phosphorylase
MEFLMLSFITGSGFYDHQQLNPLTMDTPFGVAQLKRGRLGNREVIMLSRHGDGHHYLPHHINHRANLWALKSAGATAVISCSVCGILNPAWPLGTPFIANDLYFPDNRLGDGSTCTIFQQPGEPGRGHLLAGSLLHPDLSRAIARLAPNCYEGTYGQVSGPRFNTRCEIRALQHAGVDFISQTCGPEAVLANELELPHALAAFGIDYANGVVSEPTPIKLLQANLEKSRHWFSQLMESVDLTAPEIGFQNFIYRFD